MRVFLTLTMCLFMATAAAQHHCDSETQYEKDGVCCKMCGPGYKMRNLGTCDEPLCDPCAENEYQDKYTKEDKCERQPYCDPNKNFASPVHQNTKKTTCVCKEGFYCSTKECLFCIEHSTCTPGSGVQIKGSQTSDTVCQKCPEGTYSNETSKEAVCNKWTECDSGYEIYQQGTDKSDNTCVYRRTHIALYCIIALLLLGAVAAVILLYRKKSGYVTGTAKGFMERLNNEDEKTPDVRIPVIRMPVENEDELSVPEMSTEDHGATLNGNYVAQEFGKAEVVSRQESQTGSVVSVTRGGQHPLTEGSLVIC
ncbi:unnamed protein product [Menidia menidia]|uniref:(Atlantic silverside) hypothetical protein n=1 Tax=Menidia menidia TaxID=238744 RepID=A0A8S4BU94_9TELE|nr:unnamed protein product [Menidia menidia]